MTRREANITLQIDVIHTTGSLLPGRFFELNIHYGVYIGGKGDFHELFLGKPHSKPIGQKMPSAYDYFNSVLRTSLFQLSKADSVISIALITTSVYILNKNSKNLLRIIVYTLIVTRGILITEKAVKYH